MPGPSLSLEVQQYGTAYVVVLAGDIDMSSLAEFQNAVEPLCRQPNPHVVLDCSGLNYINSTGLGLLFTLSRTCRENSGRILLAALRPKVMSVVKVLGLENLLAICATVDEALAGAEGA